jgi:hypothetical protein
VRRYDELLEQLIDRQARAPEPAQPGADAAAAAGAGATAAAAAGFVTNATKTAENFDAELAAPPLSSYMFKVGLVQVAST